MPSFAVNSTLVNSVAGVVEKKAVQNAATIATMTSSVTVQQQQQQLQRFFFFGDSETLTVTLSADVTMATRLWLVTAQLPGKVSNARKQVFADVLSLLHCTAESLAVPS